MNINSQHRFHKDTYSQTPLIRTLKSSNVGKFELGVGVNKFKKSFFFFRNLVLQGGPQQVNEVLWEHPYPTYGPISSSASVR